MAKFLAVFALASTAAAMDSIGYPHGGGHGHGYREIRGVGLGGLGYGISGLGVSKQISSIGAGHHGLGGVGISRHVSSVGTSAGLGGIPYGLIGVGGLGGVGVTKQISSSIGHHHHHNHHHHDGIGIGSLAGLGGGISSLGSLSGIGHIGGITGINRVSSVASIPGGYYGGILSYPTSIGASVSAKQLHIPGAAIDTYRGYFGGYYPGSIGYGQSYRFFH